MKETKIIHQVCNGKKKIYRVFSQHREIFANATHPILVVDPYKENNQFKYNRLKYVDVQDLKTWQNTCDKRYCHRFLLPRQINEEYVELKQIEVKHYVRRNELELVTAGATKSWSPTLDEGPGIIESWSTSTVKDTVTQYDVPREATEEFARWFGFMIGDGFVSRRRNEKHNVTINQVGFALGDDTQTNEKYKLLFEKR